MLSYYQKNELTILEGHPYQSDDRRYTCLFKGDIINEPVLRQQLIKTGRHFETSRIEEVILALFLYSNDAFATLFQGKFVIVIIDHQAHQIIAARDCFGIENLYYKLIHEGIAFSSTLTPFKPDCFTFDMMDHAYLPHYFSEGYFIADQTHLAHIYHLPAGCLLKYDAKSGLDIGPFTHMLAVVGSDFSVIDPQKCYDVITASIRDCTKPGDVLGLIYNQTPADFALIQTAKQAGNPLLLFQATFKNNPKTHSQIIHRQMTPDDYWESAIDVTRILDLPLADPQIPVDYLLGQLAQKKVDVILATDGADLLFGKTSTFWEKIFGKKKFELFSETEKHAILKISGDKLETWIASYLAEITDLKQPFKQDTIAINTSLKKSTVFKTQIISDHIKKPVRYPFLDDKVMEMANFLTRDEKLDMALFKKIFETKDAGLNWPMRKSDHQLPLAQWMRGELYDKIMALFCEEVVSMVFKQEAIIKLLIKHRLGRRDFSEKIWAIVIFIFWMKNWVK